MKRVFGAALRLVALVFLLGGPLAAYPEPSLPLPVGDDGLTLVRMAQWEQWFGVPLPPDRAVCMSGRPSAAWPRGHLEPSEQALERLRMLHDACAEAEGLRMVAAARAQFLDRIRRLQAAKATLEGCSRSQADEPGRLACLTRVLGRPPSEHEARWLAGVVQQ